MRRDIATPDLRWIDISDPSADDLRFLREDLEFHPVDVAECERPTHLPKVEPHPTYLFLVIHVPVHDVAERATRAAEFDIFVSPRAIVTVHANNASLLDGLFRRVEEQPDVKARMLGRGSAYVLYSVLDQLFETAFPSLDHIAEKLSATERRIFAGEERRMVTELSALQRDLTGFRSILRPQRHLYEAATLQGDWASPTFRVVFRSLHAKLTRMWEYLETLWERTDALAATNAALLNYKLNEFVKMLTILSAFLIPFGLIAQTAVFIDSTVPVANRIIFWSIITVMLVVDYAVFWIARQRKIL